MRIIKIILFLILSFPAGSMSAVIFSEDYNSIADGWDCYDAIPSGWSQKSTCLDRTINSVHHTSGEITSGGRTGNSLKQWKGPGINESTYTGTLDKIFNSTEWNNHYRAMNSRFYVKVDPDLDATGCTGECPKFTTRFYGSTTAGDWSNYQVILDINGSTMRGGTLKVYVTYASAPKDNMYVEDFDVATQLFDGNWHCVELGIVVATYGQANGEIHLYVDGEELSFGYAQPGVTGITYNWPNNVYISWPMVPGVGNITVENVAQWTTTDGNWKAIEWDDLVVATSYIGPDGGSDTDPPIVSAAAVNATTATITFDETVVTTGYDAADFNLDCSTAGTNISLTSPSGTGSSRTFTIATSIPYGDTCNLDYVGGTDDIEDTAGNDLATFSDHAVTNNTPNPAVNGVCGTNSGGSFTSLASDTTGNCATGTVSSFSGSGPWTWGCNGSGGGTSTASNACTASLATANLLLSEDFEDTSFSGRGWYDGTETAGTITTSEYQSGTHAYVCVIANGGYGCTAGNPGRHLFTATDELYVDYYVKFATGWRGSQQTYHPHMITLLSDADGDWDGNANNYLTTYIEQISDVGSPYIIRPQIALQDQKNVNTANGTPPNNLTATTENRSVNYCNTPVSSGAHGTCYSDITYYSANEWKNSTASIATGEWHHVQSYFKMNTISGSVGQHDGVMKQWVDGILVIDHSDVLYRTNQRATLKWHQFILGPYIGDGSPIAQTMYIDNLNVYDAIPGEEPAVTAALTGGTCSGCIIRAQ